MILARRAAPIRAARVTALVLAAAGLRAALLPLGDLFSTAVFGACLLTIACVERGGSPAETRWGRGSSLLAGLAVGGILLMPVVAAPLAGRPLGDFWGWAAIATVIATLEEAAIRGALQRRWTDDVGPVAALLASASVFALVHLPRYGIGAMPLDFAVGLALGGLRAITGRVFPCAVAHTIADWGAWFWA